MPQTSTNVVRLVFNHRQTTKWEIDHFQYLGNTIPVEMRNMIVKYIDDGVQPSHFLKSIIANDLVSTVLYADTVNIWLIPVYVKFFHLKAPGMCWGSIEKLESWKGLNNFQ